MASFNQSVLGGPLLHLRRFVCEIDFPGQSWNDAEVSVEGGDGWAKRGDKQTFGWIVHPQQSVAGRKITIRGLSDGAYEVRFYRTWTGEFLPNQTAECRTGEITITVPQWARAVDSDTRHADHDVAFLITPPGSR